MIIDSDQLNLPAEFQTLQGLFLDGIASRLLTMDIILHTAHSLEMSDFSASLKKLQFELHKLTGAAGSYRVNDIADASSCFEIFLKDVMHTGAEVDQFDTIFKECDTHLTEIAVIYNEYRCFSFRK